MRILPGKNAQPLTLCRACACRLLLCQCEHRIKFLILFLWCGLLLSVSFRSGLVWCLLGWRRPHTVRLLIQDQRRAPDGHVRAPRMPDVLLQDQLCVVRLWGAWVQ